VSRLPAVVELEEEDSRGLGFFRSIHLVNYSSRPLSLLLSAPWPAGLFVQVRRSVPYLHSTQRRG
jgi:hypothetical protein